MKKLEFARVQEGENKLAIEVSNDSPVVAVISQNGMLECILVNDSFPEVLSDICGHISSELGVAAVTVDTDQYGVYLWYDSLSDFIRIGYLVC